MVEHDTKQRIESMTIDEMVYEINRGHRSRFQRDNFAYLKTCYESRLREVGTTQNSAANQPDKKPPEAKKQETMSLTKIFEAVIAGILVVFLTYIIWHNFGVQLYGG